MAVADHTQHVVHAANSITAAAAATSIASASTATIGLFWQIFPVAVTVTAGIVGIVTGCIAAFFYLVQVWDSPWYVKRKQRKHRNALRRARYKDHPGHRR